MVGVGPEGTSCLPHCHLGASWLVNAVRWGWEACSVTEGEILQVSSRQLLSRQEVSKGGVGRKEVNLNISSYRNLFRSF